jgi:lipoprotein-anchoring transpeptidase ErfK/SrfK
MTMMFRQAFAALVLGFSLILSSAGPVPAETPAGLDAVDFPAGSIVIRTSERKLYYIAGPEDLQSYSIAVGKTGRTWTGSTSISRKVRNPAWAPPPAIRRDNPQLPDVIPPGPGNPLGPAVLVLGDGTYGIHGTNKDATIGTDASYGCFRMHNEDILALFRRVRVGTPVFVQN